MFLFHEAGQEFLEMDGLKHSSNDVIRKNTIGQRLKNLEPFRNGFWWCHIRRRYSYLEGRSAQALYVWSLQGSG
jgi:hypothetical protein